MKRTINAIVIHCAATPNGKDLKAIDIDAMHKLRGFKRDSQAVRNFNPNLKSVGYHFVIEVDGTIATARGIEEIGAHVQGSNAHSIGICMIGIDKFTEAQWMALRSCLITLAGTISGHTTITHAGCINAYREMDISIKGHRDYSPDLNGNGVIERNEWIKECPCFSVAEWIKGGMMPMPDSMYV